MLSPRRGLLSPCPIGGAGGEGRIRTTAEGAREGPEQRGKDRQADVGEREGSTLAKKKKRERNCEWKRKGRKSGEIYLSKVAVAKSSQESDNQRPRRIHCITHTEAPILTCL